MKLHKSLLPVCRSLGDYVRTESTVGGSSQSLTAVGLTATAGLEQISEVLVIYLAEADSG